MANLPSYCIEKKCPKYAFCLSGYSPCWQNFKGKAMLTAPPEHSYSGENNIYRGNKGETNDSKN